MNTVNDIISAAYSEVTMEGLNGGKNTVLSDEDLEVALETLVEMDEHTQAELDLAQSMSAMGTIEVALEGLEAIAAKVEKSQENGGMTGEQADLLAASVETIMKPFGGLKQSLPTLESFAEDGGRITSTAVTLEGLKDAIASVWNTLRTVTDRATSAALKWFTTNDATLKRIAKDAGTVSDKVAASDKAEMRSKSLKVNNYKKLVTRGKFVGLTPKGIEAAASGGVGKFASQYIALAAELAEKIAGQNVQSAEDADALAKEMKACLKKMDGLAKSTGEIAGQDEEDWYGALAGNRDKTYIIASPDHPGNFAFYVFNDDDELTAPRVKLAKGGKKVDLKDPVHDAFDVGQIQTMCKAIADAANKMIADKDAIKNADKTFSAAKKAGAQLVKMSKNDKMGGDAGRVVRAAMTDIKMVWNDSRTLAVESRRHNTNVLFAAFGFVKDSYRNLKGAIPAGEEMKGDDTGAGEGGDDK